MRFIRTMIGCKSKSPLVLVTGYCITPPEAHSENSSIFSFLLKGGPFRVYNFSFIFLSHTLSLSRVVFFLPSFAVYNCTSEFVFFQIVDHSMVCRRPTQHTTHIPLDYFFVLSICNIIFFCSRFTRPTVAH